MSRRSGGLRAGLSSLLGWWHAARARGRALLQGERLDDELHEELQFHLEQSTRKYQRGGASRNEAERLARQALGDAGRIREAHRQARGVVLIDELLQDVRYGLRRLSAAPAFTAAMLLTLGLGIGAVTTIYSAASGLLLNPVPFRDLDSLVVLGETTAQRGLEGEGWTHPADLTEWRRQEAFSQLAALRPRFALTLTAPGEPTDVIGYWVSPEYFELLGVEPLHGRTLSTGPAAADEPAVILGHRFWQRRFGGDPGIIGETVTVDGRPWVVIGILPPNAEYPMGTDLYAPLSLNPEEASSYEGPRLAVVGRLAPGVSIGEARAALAVAADRVAEAAPDTHAERRADVASMVEVVTYGSRRLVAFLLGAAGFLLLLVAANVANLQLARAASRREEMAVRQALGAGRVRLVRQLLAENVSLALLAGALGTLLAVWGSQLVRAGLSGEWLRFFFIGVDRIGVDGGVLAFAMTVSLGVTTLCGLVPALRASDVSLGAAIKAGGRSAGAGGTPQRGRLRATLVVAEVALSVILLCGAGLMVRSFSLMAALDRGFDDEVQAIEVRLRGPRYATAVARQQFFAEGLERIGSLPGAGPVAVVDRLPELNSVRGTSVRGTPILIETETGLEQRGSGHVFVVSADYFTALGIPLLAGRTFTRHDGRGTDRVAVVSRALAARVWSEGRGVGERLQLGGDATPVTVVGIAEDVSRAWNDARPATAIYLAYTQSPAAAMRFLLAPRDDAREVASGRVPRDLGAAVGMAESASGDRRAAAGLAQAARQQLWEIDATLPIGEPQTLAEAIDERARGLRLVARLMGGFAGAALLLCVGGIYAMVAHSVASRTREIGVRMAMGAGRRQVTRLFLRRGLLATAIGLGLGLPAAWLLGQALAGFMLGVLALRPSLYAAVGLGLLAVGALASWLPARRAAGVDPATTLQAQ